MREAVLEYLLNAAWQLPLIAGVAWLLSRVAQPSPRLRCWTWSLFLILALVSPLKLHLLAAGAATGAGGAPDAHSAPAQAMVDAAPAAPLVSLTGEQTRLVFLLWLGVTVLAAARLAFAFAAARRLVRRSQPTELPAAAARDLAAFASRRGMAEPGVRTCAAIATPVTIGWVRPVILLPEGFDRRAAHEIRAAVLHEAAHVQRSDYAFNLLCEIAALPLAWHPALYPLKAGLRAARESACDQVAAREMRSPELYAECLVTMARAALAPLAPLAQPGTALAMFGRGPLEQRVAQVLAPEPRGRLRTLRTGAAGVLAVAGVVVPAVLLHVTPSFAHEVSLAPAAARALPPAPSPPPAPTRPKTRPEDRQVVISRDGGRRRHAWVAPDGTRYVIFNGDASDLTPAQQRAIEAETRASMAKAQRGVERAQRDVARAQRDLSVTFSEQRMAQIQAQVAAAQQEVASIDQKKIAEAVARAQAEVNDPKRAARIAEAQAAAARAMNDGRVQRALERAQAALKAHHRAVVIIDGDKVPDDLPATPPPPPAPPPPPPLPDGPN